MNEHRRSARREWRADRRWILFFGVPLGLLLTLDSVLKRAALQAPLFSVGMVTSAVVIMVASCLGALVASAIVRAVFGSTNVDED